MKRGNSLIPMYAVMVAVIFTLPMYSAEDYSIIRHTTSQLGAQHTNHAWVMNVTFIGLGASSVIEGWRRFGSFYFFKAVIAVFGVSLALTGIFSHAPIHADLTFSVQEDELHSLFASLTGFSFTMFAIGSGFVEVKSSRKMLAFGIALFATLMSVLIFSVPDAKGIWQRLLFLSAFAWLIYFFEGFPDILKKHGSDSSTKTDTPLNR